MFTPNETRGRGEPSPESKNFTSGPRELPGLKIPDKINDDILRAMIMASEGVTIQSETRLRDAKCLVENIVGTIEGMKKQKDGPEQDDDTWILRAYNEIAAIYGLLGMTQQEKEMSENLLLKMEERRGPDDLETMFIVQREALRYWEWGNLKDAVLLFERAQEGQSKMFGEDSIHVIKNTLCLAATSMALSLKYAGEGRDDLRIEKLLQSTKASKRVEAWEKKQLSGDLFQVPDAFFLFQATRQMVQGMLRKTFESGLIHRSVIPKEYFN